MTGTNMQKVAVFALAGIALLGLSALGQLNTALADGGLFPQAQPNFSGEIGSKVLTNAGGALQLGAACTGGAAGDVCVGAGQKICLDSGCNSYIRCSAANTCQLYTGGNSRLQWSNSGIAYGSNVSSGVVSINYSSATAVTLPDIETRLTPVAFGGLGTPADGGIAYCSDCTKATPCASGGSGAFAQRINGAWDCD